jgi:ribokinase
MKALVFGALNIDLIFSVDHIVIPGETIPSAGLKKSAGGKGANQAAALAKAGTETYLAGKIGHDGEFLLSLLKPCGVRTEYVKVYPGPTGQALIQLDKNGQNAIVYHAGGNGEITIDEAETIIGAFDRGDIISLQNEIPFAGEMMKAAKKRGMTVCFNPSPWDKNVETLPLDLVDTFMVNEIEGPALAGLPPETPLTEILNRLVSRFPGKEIILTAGKNGAYYGCGDARAKGDIVDLPVVDTTGAGDTFTGYFLSARRRGMGVDESLRLACKAASIAVSRMGALEAIPFGNEVFSP